MVDETPVETSPNLPSNELKALSELTQLIKNKLIWIVESDKGGIICLFDASYIQRMGELILQDQSQFVQVDSDCEKKCLREIRALSRTHNFLTENEGKFIVNFEAKIANFYLLPKVLKSEAVKEAMLHPELVVSLPPPTDLKFRHMVVLQV